MRKRCRDESNGKAIPPWSLCWPPTVTLERDWLHTQLKPFPNSPGFLICSQGPRAAEPPSNKPTLSARGRGGGGRGYSWAAMQGKASSRTFVVVSVVKCTWTRQVHAGAAVGIQVTIREENKARDHVLSHVRFRGVTLCVPQAVVLSS